MSKRNVKYCLKWTSQYFCKKCIPVRNPNSKIAFGKITQHSKDLKNSLHSKRVKDQINDF